MELKNIGEFGLISEIKRKFIDMVPSDVEGIGDDCAVIPKNDRYSYVVTTDMLVEGKHFLIDKISPFELGHKSLAVNLSDVAAMGATPRFSFLSLAIPGTISQEWCFEFLRGYHSLSEKYDVALLGGDTTSASVGSVTISVTVIGEMKKNDVKRRSKAQVGDIIAVTAKLGDSALALKLMTNNKATSATLFSAHNTPEPQVKQGIWLGRHKAVNAMMDISDGVSSDITHICNLSEKGAIIFTDKIPHSEELLCECELNNWNPLDFSLSGGEDYALLMTIDKNEFENIKRNYQKELQEDIYPIGVITSEQTINYKNKNDENIVQNIGFRHF